MSRWSAPVVAVLALALSASAQLPPDKGLASLKVADGLQVELFAAEPMLLNPTSMDIDPKGRLWITEAVNYRRKNFKRQILREEGDRIVVLVDKDGDGKADESVVFYQGQELYGPLSVCVAPLADGKGYRVFVAQSPDILVFDDKDGDLKADGPPQKFLTGFGGYDHDHGVHGLNVGPDGKLYFTVGDSGVNGLQSADGKGPKWKSNATDCRAGTVWKCEIDGKNLELIAHNFRNNYEACVNSFGEVWLSDNDDDGNQQTRICFVMPGGNYGYHPRGPGQTHWHEEQPGIVHKTLRTGFGSPTGICFYEGTLLPQKYRGQLFHCDAGPRELRCFHIAPKGAGHELEKENILTSSDNWFRLSDVCVAPDGSVFACDWYDPGVGGHGMGDWTRGRVYRITPKGHAGYKVPAVDLTTKDGILDAMKSPCLSTRAAAAARLAQRDPLARETFVAARDQNGDHALKARALLQSGYGPDELLALAQILEEPTKSQTLPLAVRAAAVRQVANAIRDGRRGPIRFTPTMVKEWLAQPAAIQRELLLLIATYPAPEAIAMFYPLARKYDGKDIVYRAALNIAAGSEPIRRDAILAEFAERFPTLDDKTLDLVWELRPKSMLPKLETLLADEKVPGPQKARIVDILAASDDAAAGKAMLKLLTSTAPPEAKARAIENLRLFLPTKWSPLVKGDEIKVVAAQLLGDPKSAATGLQLIAAAGVLGAIDDVEKIGADEKAEMALRTEAVRTLGQLKTEKAVDALMRIGQPTNPMSLEVVKALGNHLPGRDKPTEANVRAFDAMKMAITLEKSPADLKQAALAALAGNRAGTAWLIELKQKNELPDTIASDAARLVRNTPFADLRNKALVAFPQAGKLDPKKLPSNAELAKRNGNPENGKRVLLSSIANEVQCLKCHAVRGLGGQIGPDLSMVGKKGSKENLFESILQPSKAIADQSVSWKIDTADGQTLTGLIVGETETAVTLRDANGKDYVVATKDIDKRSKILVSLMPENLAVALTEEELVDLVAYLATLQTPAYTPDSWMIAGPFPSPDGNAGLDKDYGPEKGPFDPAAKFPNNGKGEIAWRSIKPNAAGYVDLAAFHGDAGNNSVSYLYRAIESPEDQEATILVGNDDGAKLFVNGEEVFKSTATQAASPGQSTAKVKLKKGPNAVLAKVANGNNPHGLYFTILSNAELKGGK